ncbi:hypothetical protein [Amycolatopsis sp. cmx-11-12]|uniref:hypothetical protein n=1 Tax=Amycolatopsis sp. cmx-11-12 TaxID=2785795 RepID=UPI0039184D47
MAVFIGLPMAQSTAIASPTTPSAPASGKEHCVVVLGKVGPGQSSRVAHEHCSPTAFDKAAYLRQPDVKARLNAERVTADVLLMQWWSDTDFKGQNLQVWGGAGPCDGEGYTYDPANYWRANLSSIELMHPDCDRVTVHDTSLRKSASFSISPRYFGSAINDNVGRVHVYRH